MLKQTKKATVDKQHEPNVSDIWMPRPIWQQMLVSLTIWSILEPEISWKMPALRVQTTIVLSLVCINMYVASEQVPSEVGKKIRLQGFRI